MTAARTCRTRYEAGKAVLADCRWNCTRRMGIGDRCVAVAALQAMERGGVDVAAAWNEADDWLFRAGGIQRWYGDGRGRRWLPMSGHVMEIPMGETDRSMEWLDDNAPDPVWRALWGLGLERYAEEGPRLSLWAGEGRRGGAVWFPIEVSRADRAVGIEAWDWAVRTMAQAWGPLTMICAEAERDKAIEIRRRLSREGRSAVKELPCVPGEGGGAALEAVAGAGAVLTGNSGALWLALGTDTPCWCVQRSAQETAHARMWQAKCWAGARLYVSSV